MALTRVESWACALFGAILHFYPAAYREEYGREMKLLLVDRLRMPPTFRFPERDLDAWVALRPSAQERSSRGTYWLRFVARLKPGISLAQAQEEMNAIAARLAAEQPEDRELGIALVGLRDEIAGPFRPALLMLIAAVVGVLMIACVNVAGMLTARGAARRREVAIRTALGASRRRVLRQLLTEAVVLFVSGGVVGVALGALVLRLIVQARIAALDDVIGEKSAARRFNTWLLTAFGAAAVALTAIGLYGLLAYLVALRRRELAVRLAIGATPGQILDLMVRHVFVILTKGIGLGLIGAFITAPAIRGLLFGLEPWDPLSQAMTIAVLAAVAVAAAWIPARRAMRADPALVLRTE